MTEQITPALFRERFELAAFEDGGVVVDLATGYYSRLNASGAMILGEFARVETTEGAVSAVANRLGIPRALASEHLASLIAALAREGLRTEPIDSFRYRPSEGGGYDLWHGARRVLHVDEQGSALTLLAPPRDLAVRINEFVSAIAPKILFLMGATVLHGSCWAKNDSLLGICGKSGAGKTTTARTLAKHAGELISEDLLVFGPDLTNPAIFANGEARVHAWSVLASKEFEAGRRTVPTSDLTHAASGAAISLRSLWFLDAGRRGPTLTIRELSRADALGLITANQFLGAAGGQNWRRYFRAGHAIAATVKTYEVDMPNGLDRLDEALRTYTTNSAS